MPAENSQFSPHPVLILGGGIHGAAVARELAFNGVPVVLADTGDLATGATSKSSRLIHGGLRYLEYGDVGLVRESLIERGTLLKLAPQFVRPLRLFVPVQQRWSGLLRSALGFFKLARTRAGRRLMGRTERRAPRGYWPIRMGLWLYDLFSWRDGLTKSRAIPVTDAKIGTDSSSTGPQPPRVDGSRYRWLCAYSDAQMLYPERCVIALLTDAEHAAQHHGVPLQIVPHANVQWQGSTIHVSSTQPAVTLAIRPKVIVNCSGARGDITLKEIDAATTPLFAGTKGSHCVTRHPGLKSMLGEQGVYAETGDRRLAFILPFGEAVLVGTTDEAWTGIPDEAVATDQELQYLLNVVETVFGLKLTHRDIESHYSGVRPLPRTMDISNAAISRDHSLAEHRLHGVPVLTLVGGKLTTFRSVASQIVGRVLKTLGQPRSVTTEDRPLIGAANIPRDSSQWANLWTKWARQYGSTEEEVAALWPLYGMHAETILAEVAPLPRQPISDSPLTHRVVRWIIEHEWVWTLDDLVERRLMLIFAPRLSVPLLQDLAECLVQTGRLSPGEVAEAAERTANRLRQHYGRVPGG